MDGSFVVTVPGLPESERERIEGATVLARLPHATAAALFETLRGQQSQVGPSGVLEIAITVLTARLNEFDDRLGEIITALEDANLLLLARNHGESRKALIAPEPLKATGDPQVERPRGAGHASIADHGDDLLMRRIMDVHGVPCIAPTARGIRGVHGGFEAMLDAFPDPMPFVRYVGLPDRMPAFMAQRAHGSIPATMAIAFGFDPDDVSRGVLYQSVAGRESIGVSRLPDTLAAALPGRPATDLVGHEALEGYVIGDPCAGTTRTRHQYDLIRP